MKTKVQVEHMLCEIRGRISVAQAKAQEAEHLSDAYSYCDRQCGKLVAQYNILLEVLNGE